jgi:uncharacterized membrane protein YhfC
VTHLLNGLLMILIALGLGILLARRLGMTWRLWWIGAAAFVLSQVGHIPFNSLVGLAFKNGWLPAPPETWKPFFNPIFLGLSAGLWEGLFRYGAFRWGAREARSWGKALMVGAGHGGIEAIILGMLVLFTLLQMSAVRGLDLSSVVPADQLAAAQEQVKAYWSYPWYYPFLGALERVFALTLHLAASVLVVQVFIRRQAFWLWLAILWHALVDGTAVAIAPLVSPYAIEGVLALFALASLGIVFALRAPEPAVEEAIPEQLTGKPEVAPALADVPETDENLDETRYQG